MTTDNDIPERPSQANRQPTENRYVEDSPVIKKPKTSRNEALTLIGVAVAVSLLIIYALGGVIFVKSGNYNTDITGIVDDIAALKTAVVNLEGNVGNNDSLTSQVISINQQISSLSSAIEAIKSSPTDSATKSELSAISGTLSSLQTTVSNLQSQINNIQLPDMSGITTQINNLQTQIDALKVVTPTSTDVTEQLTVSVKAMSASLYPTDNVTLTSAFKVQITNNTDKAITDIVLGIQVQTTGILGNPVYTLSGGNTQWQTVGYNAAGAYFVNTVWGLNVDAGKTIALYLTLKARNTAYNYETLYSNVGVPYNVDARVE